MTTRTLQRYEGVAEIIYKNRSLAEATSITVADNSNNNSVVTMKKGVAGFSKGAHESEVTIENAVPRVGLEATFVEDVIAGEIITLVFISAGKRYTYEMWVESTEASQSTDSAAARNITCRGGAPRIS